MSRVVVALIIHRNRYLISKIPQGELRDKWAFPDGPVPGGETDFAAITKAIKTRLGVDIFRYITIKQLVYRNQDETIELTLIKCSITDDSKRFLSSNVPHEYDWLSLPFVAHIDFAPRDKKIVRHLTNGLVLVPPKRIRRSASKRKAMPRPKADGNRRKGFASMDPYKRTLIASKGGKKAHALGVAHRWTSEEARKAGAIHGKVLKYSKYK